MSDAIISFASLILADAELPITAENLLTLTKAAGANIDSTLEGKDLKELLSGFTAAGAVGSAAPSAGAGEAAGAEEAAGEEAEAAEEESDDDMGFGLFD
ncbi:related to 60S acidic ribosomal protein P1-beta [Saccharomycodes ludwigii]|uniref:Related to 60S acidic ribosomal protein P1-beta n=1 Tax=Saccharomycodes ludwigii TaxID=36035 RepID=A0A376B8A2_9ASCO|nr:related to 60S acidic ribosomal protein P1-beta [Saccharomycodes ludwigii]